MAGVSVSPSSLPGYSNAPLQSGVEQRQTHNEFGGTSGFQYYYDGKQYADPALANEAATAARNAASTSVQGTNVNAGTGSVVNTGGPMPSSYGGLVSATGSGGGAGPAGGGGGGGVYVPNPDGSGPMLTQAGYENERSQAGAQESQSAQQATQIKAASEAAAAADAAHRGDMELAAKLQAQAEQTRMSLLTAASGNTSPHVGGGTIAADETQARAAAFARAKEQAGQTALSSLKALHDVMGDTGRMGSSAEAQGEAGIIGGAAGDINDFTRDSYMGDLNRSAQIADRNYAGDITQRGQDQQKLASMMALITASGGVGAY